MKCLPLELIPFPHFLDKSQKQAHQEQAECSDFNSSKPSKCSQFHASLITFIYKKIDLCVQTLRLDLPKNLSNIILGHLIQILMSLLLPIFWEQSKWYLKMKVKKMGKICISVNNSGARFSTMLHNQQRLLEVFTEVYCLTWSNCKYKHKES